MQCYPRIAEQRTVMVVVSFVAAEDQLDSDRQPGGSWAFTSQLPVWLSHIVPFRAQIVYSPCSGHHCKSELIWKALRIFFFFWCEQVKAICICFALGRFYRSIETGGYRTRQRKFSSSLPSSSSFCVWLYFPKFKVQCNRTINLLSVRNTLIK